MYIPPIQVEVAFEGEATSSTGEMIIKPYNKRLMTWRINSIEHNKSDPLPAPMSLPMMKRTLFIDRGQDLHQANPSPMIKSVITKENTEALLAKELEMTLWKRHLSQISKSPFTWGIEKAKLPWRFHQPTFTIYNGQMNPVEHIRQFKQKMAVHSQDEALMCRVFPSSLGPMAMRWFDRLRTNYVSSFKKLTQAFCSRFIICSRVP